MGDIPDVSAALIAALKSEGHAVRQVTQATSVRRRGDVFEADLRLPEQAAKLRELIASGPALGGIINLAPLGSPTGAWGNAAASAALNICHVTFNLVQAFAEDLKASAADGAGWYVQVTGIDGRFGLATEVDPAFTAAGVLGIAKTLHREYPNLHVKTIDVDRRLPSPVLATRLIEEMSIDDGRVEVGLDASGRWRVELLPAAAPAQLPALPLDASAVVLITGGAYGVTAEVTRAIARRAKSKLILVGRSKLPAAESADTAGLMGGTLRARLIEMARASGQKVMPAEIERQLQRIAKDRQIHSVLDACRAAGSEVEYHAVDASNSAVFGALIDDIYSRYGRLDGVIHGAGVIEDKRIADKTLESFDLVFRTKVDSALVLAEKLRPERLKFLVFFSSVSGRFGNAGQVDYSAANEFLNKLADHLDRKWPARVVSVNWGPWDGGMVSDELRRMYAAANISLIPVDVGVDWLMNQLRQPIQASAEIVVSGGVEQMLAGGRKASLQVA